MRQATESDRQHVISIISQAFTDNKSVNYVISQNNDIDKNKRIKKLVDYAFNVCQQNGEVWLDDNDRACVMYQKPHEKRFSVETLAWDVQMALNCIGLSRVLRVLKRESLIKQNHPKEPFFHLWFIGVLPEFQGEGTGTSLLRLVQDKAKLAKAPIYLETSVEKNLKWYKDHQFDIYNTIDFEDHRLYLLRSEG